MNIRVLRYFMAVSREENILSASKTLNVTQPTLSRQLKELEEELGVTLFLRRSGNRRIVLTEEGILLRKRADEILALIEKTKLEITQPGKVMSGNIHIGSGESYIISLLSKVIRDIREDYPNMFFHLFSGNADDVTERLDKGLIDFGILPEPVNISKYDSVLLPAVDTWGLLMRKEHPLAKKEVIKANDLWGIPLISSSQQLLGSMIFSKWLMDDFEQLNHVATYTLLYNASLLVKDGIGCALCLDKIIATPEDGELCFRPLNPPLEAHWHIVWKKYQVFSKASQFFLSELQESFLV